MTHAIDVPTIVAAISALLYIALGLWVFTLTPRRRQTTLLGLFALSFGLSFAIVDTLVIFHLTTFTGWLFPASMLPFIALAYAAALGLAWSTPEPLEDRRVLGTAVSIGAGLALLEIVAHIVLDVGIPGSGFAYGAWVVRLAIPSALLWSAAVLLALRAAPSRAPGPAGTRQLALLAVAFAMLDAVAAGVAFPLVVAPSEATTLAPGVLTWLIVAGLWLSNMVRAGDETVRIHRAAGLSILGLLAVGAIYQALYTQPLTGLDPPLNHIRGIARTLGVALLAYGILRHDLAGLDAKVEWGVSKTTVAGVFIAVFFVVSEGAQVLFADVAGDNEWIGVVAAGALVFALSPLQRFADRFAAKAVPGGAEAGADAEARYRDAVEMALADGEITREEERHLARLATRLGIDPERALALREQVEEETGEAGEGVTA